MEQTDRQTDWHVAERYEESTSGGQFGDDAVGTARFVLYRKRSEPWKFMEIVHYVEYVRATNQPPVSNCPACERVEVQESIIRGVFHCEGWTGCGHTWADQDAESPMRYSVETRQSDFEGEPGQPDDEIRNEGTERIEYDVNSHYDCLWHHTLESAQRTVDRLGRTLDDSEHIHY